MDARDAIRVMRDRPHRDKPLQLAMLDLLEELMDQGHFIVAERAPDGDYFFRLLENSAGTA